jgi:translation initiation factor IF-2
MPVKIIGLKAAPSVGDILEAKSEVAKKSRIKKYQLVEQAVDYAKSTDTINEKTGVRSFNIVLKADVLGSLEAIIASLTKMDHPEVKINIISKGLGNINESDIKRAETANAVIFGFHVKPTQDGSNLAKEKKVEIKYYDIIYKLLEDAKKQLEQLLSPEVIRTDLGRLKVLAIFRKEDKSMIIGGSVTKGIVKLGAKVDVIRDKVKLASGHITQLQANKVNVNEAGLGKECGMKYEGKPVIEQGDFLEVYLEEIKEKKLN